MPVRDMKWSEVWVVVRGLGPEYSKWLNQSEYRGPMQGSAYGLLRIPF